MVARDHDLVRNDAVGHGPPRLFRERTISERRVAALVYRRRLHVVNVFLWPSTDGTGSAPRELTHRGYNVVTWTHGGITYWAVSDLNMAELRQLQAHL